MREGESPKGIFYIFQGAIRKVFKLKGREIHVKKYYQGDFCPKSLGESLNYDLIAECTCEIIIIPRKALNIIGLKYLPFENEINELTSINKFLKEKNEWTNYKDKFINQIKS